MFGFGKIKEKEIEYRVVKGKVARIGSVGASEYTQKYVILLEGDRQSYISRLEGVGEDVIALTQPGDLVVFKVKQGYLNIQHGSFINETLSDLGYMCDT